MTRPSDHALWTAVIDTLQSAILTHVDEPYASLQAQRLVGLALYARDRGPDTGPERDAAIAALIGGDDPASVLTDPTDDRRPALRALLMDHLEQDLATERVLLTHFGQRPTTRDGMV